MARIKGSANFSGTIEPLAGGALDARSVIPAKADLTASGTFPYPYIGMETYVVAEDKKYRLIGADPTDLTNWEELGNIEVDDEISSTSENPVQNKVIKDALDDKQDEDDKMTESDMDDVVNPIPGAGPGGGGVSDFNDLENRPTKEVTSMSNIVTPLPGTMSRRMKYSTEEQVIGEWIDGKPIYQKTYNLSSVSLNTWTEFGDASLVDCNIVSIDGIVYTTIGFTMKVQNDISYEVERYDTNFDGSDNPIYQNNRLKGGYE